MKEKISKLQNGIIIYQVNLNKELEVSKPITLSELCIKLSRRTKLNIKLISPDILLNKLLKHTFIVLINDEIQIELKLKVVEKPLKGKSKIIGLKSTIVKDNEIILTGFGEKNITVLEHKIIDNKNEKLQENTSYDVKKVNDVNITLSNQTISSNIDNPMHSKDGKNKKLDYLEKKDDLELEYFGKNFNDNLHIQLIYNILDIKKILGLYVEDINYVICNLGRPDKPEDLMGMTPYHIPFDKNTKLTDFNNYYLRAKPYFIYFRDVLSERFFDEISSKLEEYKKKRIEKYKKEELYNVLRILSLCRQCVKHGAHNQTNLFNIQKNSDITDLVQKINDHYNNAIETLNKNFVKSSSKNIYLIMKALGLDTNNKNEVKQIVNEYYTFTMKKDNKNLGFDFTKVREQLIAKLELELNETDKSRYYQIINFIIYKKLDSSIINNIVSKLRMLELSEEKEKIYDEFTDKLIPVYKNIINQNLIQLIDDEKTTKHKYFENIDLSTLLIIDNSNTEFAKLIYYLCAFLEPKGINMLVTSLINKFDNIKGLIETINQVYNQKEINFKEDYKMFKLDNVNTLIENLKLVLTLSRMKKNNNKQVKNKTNKQKVYNTVMYHDAYYLLGFTGNIKNFHEQIFAIKGRKGAPKKTFKNFLLSSVINSNKFRYIIQYANPKECYKIIQNETILRYVLNNMPESQIDRYCEVVEINTKYKKDKIEGLIYYLKQVNIYYLKNNYDKETTKITTLTGLYMAILFILIKQLVRINSYYSIAFSTFERDRSLYKFKEPENIDLDLVELFVNKGKMKKHTAEYLRKNIEEFKDIFDLPENIVKSDKYPVMTSVYRVIIRNQVEHLNSISNLDEYIDEYKGTRGKMNSYFELYQYITQRVFFNKYEELIKNKKSISEIGKLNIYKQAILNTGTYCKDLLHILTMPFAYNLARYKNLSIEDIFNDQYDDDIKIK